MAARLGRRYRSLAASRLLSHCRSHLARLAGWCLPAEGEGWLLGLILLIVLLGALRHRLEPLLVPPPPPVPAAIVPRQFGRLDLNRASASQLEDLPRIGPRLAARILSHRRTVGEFPDLQSLTEVRGIGPVTLARVTPYLYVAPRDSLGGSAPIGSPGGGSGDDSLKAAPPVAER